MAMGISSVVGQLRIETTVGCESHRYTTENDGGSADRPVNAVRTVSPSPNVTAVRAASVVAASRTAGGSRNSIPVARTMSRL